MALVDLVVRAGDRAESTGTVVRSESGGYAIGRDVAALGVPTGVPYPATAALVPIQGAGAVDLRRFEGKYATAVGVWREGELRVERVMGAKPAKLEPHTYAAVGGGGFGSAPVDGSTPDRALTAEAPLWASGAMIWRVALQGPAGRQVLVAAHDGHAVEAALAPVYGAALHVVVSPWGPDAYRAVDDVITAAETEQVLAGVERGITRAGLVVVHMEVRFVSESLESLARGVPEGLMTVDAALAPARR